VDTGRYDLLLRAAASQLIAVSCLIAGAIAPGGATNGVQDLVAVAPESAKVEYEDARVRVVRLTMAPNTSSPMHDRPRRVVIGLTASEVTITRPDGANGSSKTQALRPAWSEPGRRAVANLASRLENIIVELKTANAPGVALARPPSVPPPEYLQDPRHTWLFENQYVRIYEARIPPGEMTNFHRHAYDTVTLRVSGGNVTTQLEDGAWGEPMTIEAGSVAFDADSKKPFVHRVRNDGTSEYHVILVQLLRN